MQITYANTRPNWAGFVASWFMAKDALHEGTVKAPADHGDVGELLPADGGDSEAVLAQFAKAGVDVLAARLQDEGTNSFVSSWRELMGVISAKSAALAKAKYRTRLDGRKVVQ